MSDTTIVFKRFEFEAGGRKWSLPRPTLGVERAYSMILERKAADIIARNRASLGPQGYAEAMRQFVSHSVGNYYGWMQQGFCDSLQAADNMAQLIREWVNSNHPADGDPLHIATEKDAYVLYTDPANKAALDAVMADVFSDPNPLQPEAK